ncbi:MAG: tRNA (adenosine(37)-N6)-threonylcarbamoyltransferase complex transferase subunit TsaD [Candidatus Onthovivens sp.]|nr:tRNA (adenosine(37)-N6)-threonylcarbamoyltransferase complex transferase subunit TsaD [Candidatus Onthovivens sp.]
MKDKIILGLESSCDETAVGIIKNDELVANVISSQIEVHRKYGGVMPEIASRLHLENILCVIDDALKQAKITLDQVDAFAITRGPGLIGALHVGLQAVKTLALIYNKPIIPVHHLAGHIYANEFVAPLKFPCLALVVSGGNTELVYMKEHLSFEVIGETKDDAIGESFDKVARTIGLPYPGGVAIDKLAKEGKHTYNLPSPLKDHSLDFSYSGLKTAVINLVHKEEQNGNEINKADLAKSFQDVAVKELIDRVRLACEKYCVKQVVLAGGVSANSYLREEITKLFENSDIEVVIPPIWCTTDNAAMIAKVGSYLYDKKVFADLSLGVDPSWRIENFDKFQ